MEENIKQILALERKEKLEIKLQNRFQTTGGVSLLNLDFLLKRFILRSNNNMYWYNNNNELRVNKKIINEKKPTLLFSWPASNFFAHFDSCLSPFLTS